MADYLTTDTELTSVANAIRTKGGTSASLVYPTGFVTAIENISTGTDVSDTTAVEADVRSGKYFHKADGSKVQGSIADGTITNNTSGGTSSGTINRGSQIKIGKGHYANDAYYQAQANSGTKNITSSGTTSVDGYENASVAAGSASTPATAITANPSISVNSSGLITATVSKEQSVTPSVSAGYVSSGTAGTITVSGSNTSQLTTQAGSTIAPTESVQTAVASGKYTTGDVKIGAISSTYVGSGIDRNDSTDLSASGDTVTVPAGYYANQASKTVAAGSTTQNAPTVNSSGLVTATATVTAGYQSADTKSNTLQLTTQAAQTITPTTSDQTIASGKYLTGTQTIKGDANLVAENIAKDVTIFGVTGTHEGGGGNPEAEDNDVIFIDYDGTIRYSYSASEFANLTELPPNPTHEGLTAQGWNWTLADAKTFVADAGGLIIGQMYVTDDGKTRLYISIPTDERKKVEIRWYQSKANGATLNWGDNTSSQTIDTSGYKIATHEYTSAGDYVITFQVNSGVIWLGSSTNAYSTLGEATDNRHVFLNMLKKVEIGSGVETLQTYSFYYCESLETITVPSSLTTIANSSFRSCYSLKCVVCPINLRVSYSSGSNYFKDCYSIKYVSPIVQAYDITSNMYENCKSLKKAVVVGNTNSSSSTYINGYAFKECSSLETVYIQSTIKRLTGDCFYNCYNLKKIEIPNIVTEVGGLDYSAFNNCYSLTSITVPSSISKSLGNAFYNCYGMRAYHMLRQTPPTIKATTFNGIPSDCIIYVPYSADHSILAAYQSASNWSDYASYIQEEPQ